MVAIFKVLVRRSLLWPSLYKPLILLEPQQNNFLSGFTQVLNPVLNINIDVMLFLFKATQSDCRKSVKNNENNTLPGDQLIFRWLCACKCTTQKVGRGWQWDKQREWKHLLWHLLPTVSVPPAPSHHASTANRPTPFPEFRLSGPSLWRSLWPLLTLGKSLWGISGWCLWQLFLPDIWRVSRYFLM